MSWFLSHSPPGKACFCLELQDGERMEAVMNGSTQPSQLVEQVKAAGKGSARISEGFLSAQSSVRVSWLEEKVLPFTLHFAVSWLWRSFAVLVMVLKSLLQLKDSGRRARKKMKISICRWSWATLGLQRCRQKSPNLLRFLWNWNASSLSPPQILNFTDGSRLSEWAGVSIWDPNIVFRHGYEYQNCFSAGAQFYCQKNMLS